MRKQLIGALALVAVTATALSAHDLFLKLQTYFIPVGAPVRVAVLNGTFTASEAAVAADRLIDLSVVGPTGRRALPRSAWRPAGDTTWLTIRTGGVGTYMIGASLAPRALALSAEDFNGYLKEDGIPDVLEARTRAGELGRAVRERYHKHVKAILQVGNRRSDAFKARLGYPAELVPATNPYALTVGDSLAFQCLVDGRPVAQQLVIAGGEQDGQAIPEVRARSDGNGMVRFALDRPGRWYVKFIHMEPVSGDSVDYESKWASLTFELRR